MTSCSACPTGSVPSTSSGGATACSACPVGTGSSIGPSGATAVCTPCSLGSYRNASMAACEPCPAGSVGVAAASPPACAPCPGGHYSANTQQCLACSPGTYAPSGSGACATCNAARCGPLYQVTARTVAGSRSGFYNGVGPAALFNGAVGLDLDSASGVAYVSDTGNNCIRRVIAATGASSTLAGNCQKGGFADGVGGALFSAPSDAVWSAATSSLYICDSGNHRIRQLSVTAAGALALVTTLAGSGAKGRGDGVGLNAQFHGPRGCDQSPPTTSATGAPLPPSIYVADSGNNAIRRVAPTGAVSTLVGGSCANNRDKDGVGAAACLHYPTGIAASADGTTVFFADSFNRKIKAIALATSLCYTLAQMPSFAAAAACTAATCPYDGLVVDAWGSLVFTDSLLSTIYQLPAPAPFTGGRVSTTPVPVLGKGAPGSSLDGTSSVFAALTAPRDLALDAFGRIFFMDGSSGTGLSTLKVLQAESYAPLTLAGGQSQGADDGTGTAATFQGPWGLAVSSTTGSLFAADSSNGRVRCITPAGAVSTLAGGARRTQLGSAVDSTGAGSAGTSATFAEPKAVAYVPASALAAPSTAAALFVTDGHAVRMVTLSSTETSATAVATIAGSLTGTPDFTPCAIVAFGSHLYVADGDGTVRQVHLTSSPTPFALASLTEPNFLGTSSSYPGTLALVGSRLFMTGPHSVYVHDLGLSGPLSLPITPALVAGGTPQGPFSDGSGTGASFTHITAAAHDLRGSLILADGQHLRAMDTDTYAVRTLADLGAGTEVPGLAATQAGLYYTDPGAQAVRALLTGACPAGSYCPSRWLTLPCAPGTYGAVGGLYASTCTAPCPAGHFCPTGTSAPLPCPPGSFCPPGAASPTLCPPGTSNALAQAAACVLCAPGLLAPRPGSLVCNEYCPAGTSNSNFGGTTTNASCTACAPGSYAASLGSTSCTECKAGRFSASLGAGSAAACAPCPPGLQAPETGALACKPCADPTQSSSDGITCAAYACPAGLQSLGAARPSGLNSCTPLNCTPPLAPPRELSAAGSYCEGCPPGTIGVPGACAACPRGSLCPGGGSRPLRNFSSSSDAGSSGAAVNGSVSRQLQASASSALWAACPALTPGPVQTATLSLTWVGYLAANALTLIIVMGSLLLAVLLVYLVTRLKLLPTSLASAIPRLLSFIDFFYLKRAVINGAQPVARYSAAGGMWTLVALSIYLAYAVYLILEWSQSNTAVARTLDIVGPSAWALADAMPPALASVSTLAAAAAAAAAAAPSPAASSISAAAAAAAVPTLPAQASGILVRLTLDGEAGACATLQAPGLTSTGLSLGAWSVVGSTASCGGTGTSQITLACPNCDFTQASALVLPLHYSCQSMMLEMAAVGAYPGNAVSFQRALVSATATSRLAAVQWTVVPVLDVRVDNTSASTARGYQLLSSAPVPSLVALPLLGSGNIALTPNPSSVLLTINMPVSATYIITTISIAVPWYTLVANLLGLTSIITGIGFVFLILEEQRGTLDSIGKTVLGVELGAGLVGSAAAAPPSQAAAEASSGSSLAVRSVEPQPPTAPSAASEQDIYGELAPPAANRV